MITINEADINFVTITDGICIELFEKKEKGDTEYHITYSFSNVADNEAYCPKCGSRYLLSEHNVCPACEGKDDETISYEDISDMIYSCIEDDCTVTVELFGGESHTFSLDI